MTVLGGKTLARIHRGHTEVLAVATRFAHISGGILSHSNLQILSKSLRFWGWCLVTRTFSSLHICSMGLMSGEWLGHSRTLICFLLSHSFVALAMCFGSLSCWNTHPQPISMTWPWWFMAPSTLPLMRCSCPVPLAEKQPPSIMFPPPCLTVRMVFLGSWAAFLLLQIRQVKLMPKIWILVSSDHNTFTQFFSESLANFRWVCTCDFLSRGTLRALQNFSPSWRSVLTIVFLVTMLPAALRSLTRSSHVLLGWFFTILMIIETPRGEILHGAPVRGTFTVFVFLPFVNNRTSCCHLLIKLFGDGLVAHSSLE